jgi:hypothetical protein
MFSKRFVAASAVAVTSFAAIAGEPPASLKAADPAAQASQTTYTSVLSTYRPAEDTSVSPDKVWKEANATVANEGMHGDAQGDPAAEVQDASGHAGHKMPTQSANPDAHAGHRAPAEQASQGAHAGHQMPTQSVAPAAPTGQPSPAAHTGHQMAPAPKSDPHAGHQMAPVTKPDAHAGHQMGQEKKPAKATPPAPASDAGNSSHGQHQQHQEEGTKK